ncbi:MAG: hypothetical protein P8X90_06590 [Desulfobacterales bacterium]|jgi:DNA repair photolyase
MKSITIHNIDEPLAELIESKARAEGLSINKTVKKLLEESLGVKPREKAKNRSDFEEFCGIWSDSELAEFEDATKDMRKVDREDWK